MPKTNVLDAMRVPRTPSVEALKVWTAEGAAREGAAPKGHHADRKPLEHPEILPLQAAFGLAHPRRPSAG